MVCRMAGYLGCAPYEVRELPADDFDLLARYFDTEPWGAWRDNFHAAMIAREVRRIRFPRSDLKLSQWFFINPARRAKASVESFKWALMAMAGGVRKHVSEAIKRPVRRKKAKPK